MENNFLIQLAKQIDDHKNEQIAQERKLIHFREIGRKGGLKKKMANHLSKIVSIRFTEREFAQINQQAERHKLNLSKYLRMVATGKELKVHEFKTDQVLLDYGNNFARITNLLRNREWSDFESKKAILLEIDLVAKLLREYLYEKLHSNE